MLVLFLIFEIHFSKRPRRAFASNWDSFFTFRFRLGTYSGCFHGPIKCWRDCWAATWSAFTSRTIVSISWTVANANSTTGSTRRISLLNTKEGKYPSVLCPSASPLTSIVYSQSLSSFSLYCLNISYVADSLKWPKKLQG